jgi:dihydroorotate dehydrogenase electron transfer subunit
MLVKALIKEHRKVASDIFMLTLSAPEVAVSAKAGQFIHIKCGKGLDPLLRRPFSLSEIDRSSGTISIIYEVRGKGTKLLSDYLEGQELDVLGPLGNSFFIEDLDAQNHAILVGGGIGAPPMAALGQALKDHGLNKVTIILGAATKDKLLPEEIFTQTDAEVLLATDDGTMGHKGFVTELLPQTMDNKEQYVVFACGPGGMLKAVGDYCLQRDIPCQLSLEEVMACGVGACQGCACKVKDNPGFKYVRVCREGPVFKAGEVVWDE